MENQRQLQIQNTRHKQRGYCFEDILLLRHNQRIEENQDQWLQIQIPRHKQHHHHHCCCFEEDIIVLHNQRYEECNLWSKQHVHAVLRE